MKIKISCDDKYEAQKLSSMIYNEESKETFITNILSIFDNEIVISLKDKSAHSIVLKDEKQVELFADFIQSVIEKNHKIVFAKLFDDNVEIEKA